MTNDRLEVVQNICRPYAQRLDALEPNGLIPTNVPLRAIPTIVRFPIDLDRQPRLAAEEVQYVGAKRMLSSKFQPGWSSAQHTPEQDFGQAHRATKPARPKARIGTRSHKNCPSTMLRMVPLPAKMAGRISDVESGPHNILPAISRGGGPSAKPAVEGHHR